MIEPNRIDISFKVLFDYTNTRFMIKAFLRYMDKLFVYKKYYAVPLSDCIGSPMISKVGLRKFIHVLKKDMSKPFGKEILSLKMDYDKIYNYIETARLNTVLHINIPMEDNEV
jgi:hypothetical protein